MDIHYQIQRMVCADAYELYKIDRTNKTLAQVEVPFTALYQSDRVDPQASLSQRRLEALFNYYSSPSEQHDDPSLEEWTHTICNTPLPCNHSAVQTGMRWSYCKTCNADMVFINGDWKQK